jgi:hypothetical protein
LTSPSISGKPKPKSSRTFLLGALLLLLVIALVAYEAQLPGKDSGKPPANAASGRAETPKQSKLLLAEFKGEPPFPLL